MTKSLRTKPPKSKSISRPGVKKAKTKTKTKKVAQVSSHGRFRDTRGKVKSPIAMKSGYKTVGVQGKHHLMNRLVCGAFHGPAPSPAHEVDHIDGDPGNNRAENLRWVTRAENIQHAYATNKKRRSSAPQRSKPVRGALNKEPRQWVTYASVMEAARQLKLNPGAISNCCHGKTTHAGHYVFEFDTEAAAPEVVGDEEWRDVVENPDEGLCRAALAVRHQWPRVSSHGRYRDMSGIVKSPIARKDGYKEAGILGKSHKLHRLVCRAFHGEAPSPDHTEVDHIDGNPGNNHKDNLRWVTRAENIQHGYNTNKNRRSNAPQLSKPVRGAKLGEEPRQWVTYASAHEAAQKLNLNRSSISLCCNGKQTQVGHYVFEFDAEAAAPEVIGDEEWRDVVL